MTSLTEAAKALRTVAELLDEGRVEGFALTLTHDGGQATTVLHLPAGRDHLAALIQGACDMQGAALRAWRGEGQ